MESISFTVNDQIIKKMKYYYNDSLIKNNNKYALFTAKTNDCTITAYSTKKVLFQGKNALEEAKIWNIYNSNNSKNNYYLESIGSDEVGTGDYFGPIVVVSAYLNKVNIEKVKKLKIADSKVLTDKYIREIAPKLYNIIPYSLLIVNNEKYNKIINNNMNLNKLKALLHKQAITNLIKKHPNKCPIIIDQFCSIDNFNKYIEDDQFSKQLSFQTKAESKYASVAVASIMARYKFLIEFDKLSKYLDINLIKGASNKVDDQGKLLIKKYGKNILYKVAKLNFKNTNKILNN